MPHVSNTSARRIARATFGGCLAAAMAACAPPPSGPSDERPPPGIYSHDVVRPNGFVRNPAFVPVSPPVDTRRSSLVTLEGEVIVLEGDALTVSQAGGGVYGIMPANQRAIVDEVLAVYPDVFDTIQIYTSFVDQAHVGTAYYQSIRNAVSGIGIEPFNGRTNWGLPREGGRLSGFSNMNSMLMWGGGSFDGLAMPLSSYHAVIAQELSHKWLFHMMFEDASGQPSDSLLGRDGSHWSRLAQAYGSVQDGNRWRDNGNGMFTMLGNDDNFAPLDLYAMGFIAADEVEPFFYITEATTLDGDPLTSTSRIRTNETIRGNRIDVSVDDVLAAMGPRDPPVRTESPYYRAAFVLVTEPGESRASWSRHLAVLQQVQQNFPETWRTWTDGRGAICTKVSERCPEPRMGLAGYEISDGNDSLVAPGETFDLTLSVQNTGLGTAENVQVELRALDPRLEIMTAALVAPPVPQNERRALTQTFRLRAAETVPCGEALSVEAKLTTQEGPWFLETFQIGVGTRQVRADPLDEAPDWKVNPDATDTALAGQWELGEPEFGSVLGVITQPQTDHTPGEGKLSFHTGVPLLDFFAANDLDGGKTTLQSPVFALGNTRDPSLVFYVWRVAMDFTKVPPEELPQNALIVLASNDGGDTWIELGRVDELTTEWTRVSLRIRDAVAPTNRVRFRFVISDETVSGLTEAGIDDLEIIDYLDTCEVEIPDPPDAGVSVVPGPPREEGCGCRDTGGATAAQMGLAFFAIGLFGFLIRRR